MSTETRENFELRMAGLGAGAGEIAKRAQRAYGHAPGALQRAERAIAERRGGAVAPPPPAAPRGEAWCYDCDVKVSGTNHMGHRAW